MSPLLLHPSHLLRLIEDARFSLEALEAAAVGIAAGMRARTLDPDGAYHLLRAVHDSLRGKVDAIASLADAQEAATATEATGAVSDRYPRPRPANGITSAPSRNCTR